MKSKTLICLLAFIGYNSYGQKPDTKLKLGFKAGFNISSFTNEIDLMDHPDPIYSSFKRSSRGSLATGITLDYESGKRLTLGTELLFNTRGMSYREQNKQVQAVIDQGQQKKSYNYLNYSLDYLELPIIVNFNFLSERSKSKLIGYTGISAALLLHHKRKFDYDKKGSMLPDQKQDLPNGRSAIINLLGGVKLLERETLGLSSYIDLRGNFSLSPVFDRTIDQSGKNLKTHMSTFTFAFGFML